MILFQKFTKVYKCRKILSLQVMSKLKVSFKQESSQSEILLRYLVYPGLEEACKR